MALKNLRDFHDPDLVLTIGDKEYRIPQPSASKGLHIRQLFALQQIGDETEIEHVADILGAQWVPNVVDVPVLDVVTGAPVLDDDPESETYGQPLIEKQDHGEFRGGLWSEMDADGVTFVELMHAGRTALIDVGMGRFLAEQHWAQGLTPYVAGGTEGNALPQKPGPRPVQAEGNREARRKAEKAKGKKRRKAERESEELMTMLSTTTSSPAAVD